MVWQEASEDLLKRGPSEVAKVEDFHGHRSSRESTREDEAEAALAEPRQEQRQPLRTAKGENRRMT